MQLEVNWSRQMQRDQRARCDSLRKTPMRAHFPRRISDSVWISGCHTRRRISCPSCFRSRTLRNASCYPEDLATRSPCSTPPSESAAGCVKGEPALGFDSVYARNARCVTWPPLRQRRTPAWRPLSGYKVTQLPASPASPRSVAAAALTGRRLKQLGRAATQG
jgi:hypothetical protein